jgi:hypothetical protein
VLRPIAIKENAEALIVASKEIGLEVNADKTMYMVTYRDRNAGRSHSVKTDNICFETAEELKYLGTDQNCIQEEIKSRLKSENACYHLVQNLSSSSLLSALRSARRCFYAEVWVLEFSLGPVPFQGCPVAYRGGVWGVQTSPPPKFRSFDKVETDCKLSGKCLVFLFQHPD